MPEAWLRGPVPGVPAPLMPAAHALVDTMEDLERACSELSLEQTWARPGGAASIGFHLRHVAGSIDRLLTYARGDALAPAQLEALRVEGEPGTPPEPLRALMDRAHAGVAAALDVYRATDVATLDDTRSVGRAALPSTVRGLLFHAAEHARRHAGQVIATASVLKGHALGDAGPVA